MSEHRAVVTRGHARIGRKIINFDTGGYGICAWGECDSDANSLHRVRTHEHPLRYTYEGRIYTRQALCELVDVSGGDLGRHIWFAFCSERHMLYHVNATGTNALRSIESTGRAFGNLPVGSRGTIL